MSSNPCYSGPRRARNGQLSPPPSSDLPSPLQSLTTAAAPSAIGPGRPPSTQRPILAELPRAAEAVESGDGFVSIWGHSVTSEYLPSQTQRAPSTLHNTPSRRALRTVCLLSALSAAHRNAFDSTSNWTATISAAPINSRCG